jgi:uncharacterized protein
MEDKNREPRRLTKKVAKSRSKALKPKQDLSSPMAQAETARFMAKVYLWMSLGIFVSFFLAWLVGNSPEASSKIFSNRLLLFLLILFQLVCVIILSFAMPLINALTANLVYLLYAALSGLTLASVFLVYTSTSIWQVFALTSFSFLGLSGFGYVTKRDLGPVGAFCTMGLFGLLGYAILSVFFPQLMGGQAGKVYSIVGVIVFAGLTAYDTQKIKELNVLGNEGPKRSYLRSFDLIFGFHKSVFRFASTIWKKEK